MRIGIDVGSTTIKCVVINQSEKIVFQLYERHYSQIKEKTVELLKAIQTEFPNEKNMGLCISGSAGMGLAEDCKIPFIQEVYATRIAVTKFIKNTDVVIELGGEDAKILFLSNNMEVRMNGSCAGGTGAFIDQMATLLNVTPDGMNELSKQHEKRYTIASRCGVFAKSDIQALLNQGAKKSDISASIFFAVVNQTIAGLAQGREIKGNILYLGGPLTFLSQLRESFDTVLNTKGISPENSLYFVALGAALSTQDEQVDLEKVTSMIEQYETNHQYNTSKPLFVNQEDYFKFRKRHENDKIEYRDATLYDGPAYLGVDAGSTTAKAILIDNDGHILHSEYRPNSGNPVPIVKCFLEKIYNKYPNIKIVSSAVTGYGEDIIMNAFKLDFGLVETVAHFIAAKEFSPNVDFIIDIGGQDIKCFKIKDGVIDNIFLNEACSSGCGSFLQTFAGALDYTIADFAKLGLFADKPVDLGSRCTVFMNSSVKQAQKDGASMFNISSGLSISVVKNAIYKVIRCSAHGLGKNIVVQGGTFLNDAVLRAFEQEIGHDVTRPNISGLMGAYGAALYAKQNAKEASTILSKQELARFEHEVNVTTCGLCNNHCRLTVNTFDNNRKFIGGNRCEKPITKNSNTTKLNIYQDKLEMLQSYQPVKGNRGKIGIPMGLNMYELLPFWHTLFTELGFEVVTSPSSTRRLYLSGQNTIPSDTICFPAKLMHGHIQALVDQGITTIFYPCMTYNLDEKLGDNHYNCPVVAYYPEVISANVPVIRNINFIYNYLGIHRPKDFSIKLHQILSENFDDITLYDVKSAVKNAYIEHQNFLNKIRIRGKEIIELAEQSNLPIIVLAGRPYHIDPEINHSIDKLVNSCGAAVISEDAISYHVKKFETGVLNQWTYHSRLYAAAKYIATKPNMNLIQLVSFGCGVDAITIDEIRDILESENKIYTQIKIDEITNLGAVKIRLRSLFAALEQGNEANNNAKRKAD
ncbi:MAG: acyl-CoA dehydratase activase-related protein [Oscillospiraceae bacterium]